MPSLRRLGRCSCWIAGVVAVGSLMGCSTGAAERAEVAPQPEHLLTLNGAVAFNAVTPHGLEGESIIAPVGFDRLDAGWFAVVVAESIELDGRRIGGGNDRTAIALWGLNLDTPRVGESETPPWKWHYTNSVFWLDDAEAVSRLRDMGFDARHAAFEVAMQETAQVEGEDAGAGRAARIGGVSVRAEGLDVSVRVVGVTDEPTAVAPFERAAIHWSKSEMGQGVADAAYHGQRASELVGELRFDGADRPAFATDAGAGELLATRIERMDLRFQSILPPEARLGLAAVELAD